MSIAERKQQFDIVVDEVGARCRTILSCSDENLDTVLELGRHAQDIGADWIIVHAPPLYFHDNVDSVLQEYYRHISEQLDIGIAIWQTGRRISSVQGAHPVENGQPDRYPSLSRISLTPPSGPNITYR